MMIFMVTSSPARLRGDMEQFATTKFGALSDPSGFVKIEWKIDQASEKLSLSWIETGGPLVNPPSRRSFGTRMMESLGQQLSGTVRLAYPRSGFTYTLDIPVGSLNK
ncbi:hypothetical protein [Tardiphaga sp. 768_D3_N2_1]|uniref:hypothetical protein n=1 Tax=Tardiphaga sp. 768_D3_N2_1 TaxID=3240783 RepID=UPI003F8A3DF9